MKPTRPATTFDRIMKAPRRRRFDKKYRSFVFSEVVHGMDLERDDKVIARLTPAKPQSPLTVGELNAFLRNLPKLGDDADAFARDIQAIRAEFPSVERTVKVTPDR